ncbi:tetratricopeptide repeat protein [bacterium]|nr:tetratricopeptide repeat protein [bacterium]
MTGHQKNSFFSGTSFSKVIVALALLALATTAVNMPSSVRAEEPASTQSSTESVTVAVPVEKKESSGSVTPLAFDEYTEEETAASADLSQNEAIRHYEAAHFYMSRWNPEMAEVELRSAIMYLPDMKVAHRDYCLVALLRAKPLRALAEFMMVVGLGDPIPLSDEQKKSLREEAAGLHYNKGLEHASANRWREAITELLWAKKYTPLDPAVHRSLAFAYASNKQFDHAQEEYQATLDLDPHDGLAHADYAIFLSEKGKHKNAYDQMKMAVANNPDVAALHVDLGWMAESRGDFGEAAGEFDRAVQLLPEQPSLWTQLGNVRVKAGDREGAKSAFEKALALDKDNEAAAKGLAALEPASTTAKDSEVLEASEDSAISGENVTGDGAQPNSSSSSNSKSDARPLTPLKKK